jgi:hypothetical protein
MLSGELASRAKKLQREQRQRTEEAQRRAEREKAVQERLRRQREAHEEEASQRRAAEQAAAEAVRAPAHQARPRPPACCLSPSAVRLLPVAYLFPHCAALRALLQLMATACSTCSYQPCILPKQERLRHEELVEGNNGVWWRAQLRAVPLAEGAAAQKGIKRGADKAGFVGLSLCACKPADHAVSAVIGMQGHRRSSCAAAALSWRGCCQASRYLTLSCS